MTPSEILLTLCSFVFLILGMVFVSYMVTTALKLKKEASAAMKVSRKPKSDKEKSILLPEAEPSYSYAKAK